MKFTILKSQEQLSGIHNIHTQSFEPYSLDMPESELESIDTLEKMCAFLESHFVLNVGAYDSKNHYIDMLAIKYGDKWFCQIAYNLYVQYEITEYNNVFSNLYLIRDDSE